MINNAFDILLLENNSAAVGINPQGGYVSSWQLKNPTTGEFENILYQGSVQKRTGIPILFPYCGKAKDKKQHGFGREISWKVIENSSKKVVMEMDQTMISEQDEKEYPYAFTAQIEVELSDSGEMSYSLNVFNLGREAMPISPGLHPYWSVAQADKTKIVIDGVQGFDAAAIDWDTTPPDTLFACEVTTIVHLPGRNITISDATDGKNTFPYQRIWSQNIEQADFNFVCVEPVYGDDFNFDKQPIMVQPKQLWQMKVKFGCDFS